ncbi:MAG TPA: protein kinase [Phycisphaerae bacterium]|nr:protein kinase [Phycisphaerae bacterium]
MVEAGGQDHESERDRTKRLQRVLDDVLRLRAAGEALPDDVVAAEHPDLMPELGERLKALHVIEQAQWRANGNANGSSADADHIQGRCPKCSGHWRVRASQAGRRFRCRKCGATFTADAPSHTSNPATDGQAAQGQHVTIPGYQIESELGRGGMGRVYLARELATKRQVALKVMLEDRYADERHRQRFEREVAIAASLEHPHIARLYASGLYEGHHWFAMEYVPGAALDEHIAEAQLGLRDILSLFVPICQAVGHAHQRGVIHRDLKPSNVLIGQDGQPRVVDFGLAKSFAQNRDDMNISIEGEIAGTPAYMSPEQAAGRTDQLDTRTDVYSLGVMLYRLVTGQSPHDLSGTQYEVLSRIAEQDVRRPRQLSKRVDAELEAVLLKALAHEPDERYGTAAELGGDIENYLGGEPLTARRATTGYFLRKKLRKYRVQAGVAATVLVALVGTGLTGYGKVIQERTKVRIAEQEAALHARAAELARAEGVQASEQADAEAAKAQWARLEALVLGEKEEEARAALRALRDQYVVAQAEAGRVDQLEQDLAAVKAQIAGLKTGQPARRVLYVSASARGAGTGVRWADAYTDLQDALKAAKPGTEIWVATGVYRPDRGTGDRLATFELRRDVAMYGGFAGRETHREQRDWRANQTVLNGDLAGNDGPDFAGNAENSYHVVTGKGVNAATVLDGFLVEGGNANGGAPLDHGGGLYNNSSSPTVTNCVFSKCWAKAGGGGIGNMDKSGPKIVECVFTENFGGWGGGGMANAQDSNVTVARCWFVRNRAGNEGGAVINGQSPVELVNCLFIANQALRGGALKNGGSETRVVNCVLSGNRAGTGGGVISSYGSALRLTNCSFFCNSATNGSAAACVSNGPNRSGLTVENCVLWDGGNEIWSDEASDTMVTKSCVQGWMRGGSGNIRDDPMFVDADGADDTPGTEDDDLRLHAGSPCINSGDKVYLPSDTTDQDADDDRSEPLPQDLQGRARMANGMVDMGAYETEIAGEGVSPIVVGYDTTRIFAPLRPDGTVDYLAAVNRRFSEGVTPSNNAVVLLFEAFGVSGQASWIGDEIRDRALERLGITAPTNRQYFVPLKGYPGVDPADEQAVLDGPWQRAQHPAVVEWLARNTTPLSLIVEAAGRPRYYCPLLTPGQDDPTVSALLPDLARIRWSAKGLTIRANLAITEKRFEEAWRDIMATYRLGALLTEAPTLVDRLTGVAVARLACETTWQMATSRRLSSEDSRQMLQDLTALPPAATAVSSADILVYGERLWNLDAVVYLSRHPRELPTLFGYTSSIDADKDPASTDGADPRARLAIQGLESGKIDCNAVLRRVNRLWDKMAEVWVKPPAQPGPAGEKVEQELIQLKESTTRLPDPDSPEDLTEWFAALFLSIYTPNLLRAGTVINSGASTRDLAVLSVALAAYRAERGGYPTRLAALAPDFVFKVPLDICSGKPYVYKQTGEGYILYAVGINMKDDGGRTKDEGGDDIVVRAPFKW